MIEIRTLSTLSLAVVAGLFTVGCNAESSAEPAAAVEAPAIAAIDPAVEREAQEIFANRCTPCHGAMGAGDGPASAGLTPKPRNLRDKAWQQTIDDGYLEKIITYGGSAVGRSPMMPANPDLADKPVVAALRAHVRSLAQ